MGKHLGGAAGGDRVHGWYWEAPRSFSALAFSVAGMDNKEETAGTEFVEERAGKRWRT